MKSVSFLVLLICVQVYGSMLFNDSNLVLIFNSCADKQKISSDQIFALGNLQSPSDLPTQCFLACVAKQSRIMNADNSFNRTNMVNTLKTMVDIANILNGKELKDSTSMINSIADSCAALPIDPDECVAAKDGFDCFFQTTKLAEQK